MMYVRGTCSPIAAGSNPLKTGSLKMSLRLRQTDRSSLVSFVTSIVVAGVAQVSKEFD